MSGAGAAAHRLGAAACLLVALAASPAPTELRADTTALEGLAGWEGDSHGQGYGFAGFGWLVPAGPRLVVPLRALGSYLYYDFESSGITTKVRSPGVTLMSGIRFPGARGSLTLLGGGEERREHRTEDGAAGTSEVKTTSGVVLQADADHALGRSWRGFLFANYGGATRYLYGRTAIRRQMTNLEWKDPTSFFLGLEAIGQGNDESQAVQGGGFAEWTLVPRHLSLAVRGGYKDNWSPGESHHRGGYLGLSLYRRF
jgi:cellulose biosynthesis protein BcsS